MPAHETDWWAALKVRVINATPVGQPDRRLDPTTESWLALLIEVVGPGVGAQVTDLHRLWYLAAPFAVETLRDCLRMCVGKTAAAAVALRMAGVR